MENNFTFFDASEYVSNLRCTIQKSGRMGFSDFTQKKLQIGDNLSIKIGIDGNKNDYSHLLLQILDSVESNAFKINKAGNYYYFNPKALLDELGIEYKTRSIMFDMVLIDENKKIYKLIKKEGKVTT